MSSASGVRLFRQLTHTIAQRIACYLERQGLLERDAENSYLTADAMAEAPMDQLRREA